MSHDGRKLVRIGHYKMTGKVLGKGHFARVEEALHNILSVKVAVKIINTQEITDEYVQKNLKREAKIMSKVSHPNISFLYETIETDKHYYIVTEIGYGGDLCNYVKCQKNGKLLEKVAQRLARQLVSAVGHLHERGIVHRDLKMENILLDRRQENVKIVDFGLSNFYHYNGLLKTHCGSPEYAAPELYISGQKYGPEVDIWSLGVIFYGMMVGRLPFQSWYKPGLNQEEKRKLLVRETNMGLTFKHRRILMDFSYVFKNLIPKMINPNAKERMSIYELRIHPWIYGDTVRSYPDVDDIWHKKTLKKISKHFCMTLTEVCIQLKSFPYGQVGGMYNIEKLLHLNKKLTLHFLKSTLKPVKTYKPPANRPVTTTYNTQNVINLLDKRPKTVVLKTDTQLSNSLHGRGDMKLQTYTKNLKPDVGCQISTKIAYLNRSLDMIANPIPSTLKDNKKMYKTYDINAILTKRIDYLTRESDNVNSGKYAKIDKISPRDGDVSSNKSNIKQTTRTRLLKYLCTPICQDMNDSTLHPKLNQRN